MKAVQTWEEGSCNEVGGLIAVPEVPDAPRLARELLAAMRESSLYRGTKFEDGDDVRLADEHDVAGARANSRRATYYGARDGRWYARMHGIEKLLFTVRRRGRLVGHITLETRVEGDVGTKRGYKQVQSQSSSMPLPAAVAVTVQVGKRKVSKVIKITADGGVVVEDED